MDYLVEFPNNEDTWYKVTDNLPEGADVTEEAIDTFQVTFESERQFEEFLPALEGMVPYEVITS